MLINNDKLAGLEVYYFHSEIERFKIYMPDLLR